MFQTILAALKAIPLLVEAINQLGKLYHQIQVELIEKRFEDMRREVQEITDEIQDPKKHNTNDQRKDIVRRLNRAISK